MSTAQYPLPTDAEIEQAVDYLFNGKEFYHESHDCTRMAYAWFDAQKTVKRGQFRYLPLKHVIQSWACRYCSRDSVVVAAYLHPRINGCYPEFNLSARLTLPAPERLLPIAEAGLHADTYGGNYSDAYAKREVLCE